MDDLDEVVGQAAGHILRMSPPIVMDEATLLKGLDIIDEAIGETARELAY